MPGNADDPAYREPRFIDVITSLHNFALVTYPVAPEKLAKLLPDGIEPEIFKLEDGCEQSLISAAIFHDIGFHTPIMPWPKSSFEQTNYRAYIRYGKERCVWFFGTALHTPFVVVPRYVWRLPWHYVNMQISSSWSGDVCETYNYSAKGKWGNAEVELAGSADVCGTLDGFVDDEETRLVLTHPLIGYYRRTDRKVGTYNIWHDKLNMTRATVRKARFEVFETLGLIDSKSKPHSALVQRQTDFTIYLPPKLAPELV